MKIRRPLEGKAQGPTRYALRMILTITYVQFVLTYCDHVVQCNTVIIRI